MPCNAQPVGQFGSNSDHYKLTYGAGYNILGERSFGLNTGVSYKQLIIVQQAAAQLVRYAEKNLIYGLFVIHKYQIRYNTVGSPQVSPVPA
jgi:hypothetical protein